MSRDLQAEATLAIQTADFREFWPINVRKALVRAAKHEGDFPPFAARATEKALRVATAIERRMARDIEAGEAALSQADRRRLAVGK